MLTLSKVLKRISSIKGIVRIWKKRLMQHNSGMTQSIKQYTPFILAYHDEFDTREEAIAREKYFKPAAGRRFLKKKLAS